MNDSENKQILIYDTTLRDGSQAEGVSFTVNAKLRVAEKLDQFGVDYIEGGWPGSNPRDMAFFDFIRCNELSYENVSHAFGTSLSIWVTIGQNQSVHPSVQ